MRLATCTQGRQKATRPIHSPLLPARRASNTTQSYETSERRVKPAVHSRTTHSEQRWITLRCIGEEERAVAHATSVRPASQQGQRAPDMISSGGRRLYTDVQVGVVWR